MPTLKHFPFPSQEIQRDSPLGDSSACRSHESQVQEDRHRSEGQLLATRFKVLSPIGSGSYGNIYDGDDILENKKVAIKVGKHDLGISCLLQEARVYHAISAFYGQRRGFLKAFLVRCRVNALIMDKAGDSLEDLLLRHHEGFGRCFPLDDVMEIGIEVIAHIRDLHHIGYVHCDIKPDNIVSGLADWNSLKLIDFGLARRYCDIHGRMITYEPYTPGVTSVSSLAVHQGCLAGRRDDLESLGYSLIVLYKGNLPWGGNVSEMNCTGRDEYVRRCMESTCIRVLCSEMGRGMEDYFNYLRGLEPFEEPNYAYLRDCLRQNQMM